jgi:hypothetical protein
MISAAAAPLIDFFTRHARNLPVDNIHRRRERPAESSVPEGFMSNHHPSQAGQRGSDRDSEVAAPRGTAPAVSPARPEGTISPDRFEPPTSALGPLFRYRLEQIHICRVKPVVEVSTRPTLRVLGGYYKSRRLVRVYSHDQAEGPRPLEEVFETFLHEVAHHLEYTEPESFGSRGCRRVYGLMHSRLFWRIFGELKWRWAKAQSTRPR